MEASETTTHMAETSDMGDTYAMSQSAAPNMGDIYAAVSESITSDMGDTYAAETHAVMDDAPISADAHVSETVVVRLATKYGGVSVIAEIIRACGSTPVSWVVDGTGRASSEFHVVSWEGILGGGRF
jgi:hypothetical protein